MIRSFHLDGPFRFLVDAKHLLPTYKAFIPAGFPSPAEDYMMKALDLNDYLFDPPESTFGFFVSGESMAEVNIHSGDVVVVNTEAKRRKGQIVIAGINNEWAIKTLGEIDGKPCLISQNPSYPPLTLNEFDDFSVFGVVRGFIHKFKE